MRNAAGFALQKPSSPGKQLPQSKVRQSVSISPVFPEFPNYILSILNKDWPSPMSEAVYY
jgi:hypothetical protein